MKCECGKTAGIKAGNIFICAECLANTIALAFGIRRAAGEKDITMTLTGSVDPKPFNDPSRTVS